MSGLISGLAGAGGAANNAGSYYQNALGQVPQITQGDINQETAQFTPIFNQQDQQLGAKEAAMGITGSGAANADFGTLGSGQAASLAGAISPLYQQRLGIQGGILSQEPGAQEGAYNNAISQFYTGVSDLGQMAAGLPPTSQPSDYNPYANPYTAPGQTGEYGAASAAGVS